MQYNIIWFYFYRSFGLDRFCEPSHNSFNIEDVAAYLAFSRLSVAGDKQKKRRLRDFFSHSTKFFLSFSTKSLEKATAYLQ